MPQLRERHAKVVFIPIGLRNQKWGIFIPTTQKNLRLSKGFPQISRRVGGLFAMPLCCAEGHGMTWKAPHGVQWLTCDRQHCMSGLCDPCKPTYTCSDCDYDMCNVCAEVECAMPSRRTPPVEPVPLTPAADRPPRTPRTKEVPDLMPDPDSDGDDEEMEEEEGEEEEGEEAEAVEKRGKKKVFAPHKKRSSLRGRIKVAKAGPLRARVKSAKVRPTPYV